MNRSWSSSNMISSLYDMYDLHGMTYTEICRLRWNLKMVLHQRWSSCKEICPWWKSVCSSSRCHSRRDVASDWIRMSSSSPWSYTECRRNMRGITHASCPTVTRLLQISMFSVVSYPPSLLDLGNTPHNKQNSIKFILISDYFFQSLLNFHKHFAIQNMFAVLFFYDEWIFPHMEPCISVHPFPPPVFHVPHTWFEYHIPGRKQKGWG